MKPILEVSNFIESARHCAMLMMTNATYIQKELPTLDLDAETQQQIEALCDSLIGTKHDIISELFELGELISTDDSTDKVMGRSERIIAWLTEPIQEMHEVVEKLGEESSKHSAYSSVYLLLIESATNILNAFNSISLPTKGNLNIAPPA